MNKKIRLFLITMSLATALGSWLRAIYIDQDAVVFRSLESKTNEGNAVYNRIRFTPGPDKDIWIMQQSHHGLDTSYSQWDRLAIVVDKSQNPYEATFYQLVPGESMGLSHTAPLKARCYACHPNGPRAIRPDLKGPRLSLKARIRVHLWNLRIKTYGIIHSIASADITRGVPFSSNQEILKRPLKLKSCSRCHYEGGLRHELKMEHLETAKFLIENHSMPPFPFQLHKDDAAIINHLTTEIK